MKPYKPKTQTQLKEKLDPYHVGLRKAYKHRPQSLKLEEQRQRKAYYRKNKSQLKMRQKRSMQIHHSTVNDVTFGVYTFTYIHTGTPFVLQVYGTQTEVLAHIRNLQLQVPCFASFASCSNSEEWVEPHIFSFSYKVTVASGDILTYGINLVCTIGEAIEHGKNLNLTFEGKLGGLI